MLGTYHASVEVELVAPVASAASSSASLASPTASHKSSPSVTTNQMPSPYLFPRCHVSVVARDLALLSHQVLASNSPNASTEYVHLLFYPQS